MRCRTGSPGSAISYQALISTVLEMLWDDLRICYTADHPVRHWFVIVMTNPLLPADAELLLRIRHRDQTALVELHQRYRNLVYSMANQVLKNASSAEEVTQDVFFQIWRWPEKWDAAKGRFTSWLLTITRYTAIDRLRRENRQPPLIPRSLDHLADLLAKQSPMENVRHDNGRLLRTLLKELPDDQRTIILLAFFRGLTHSEIANQLQLPLGTVKSRIRLGLQKLKDRWFEAIGQRRPESE
jgi:RNA polymerase sigma-70 factor (ECF subfamily)